MDPVATPAPVEAPPPVVAPPAAPPIIAAPIVDSPLVESPPPAARPADADTSPSAQLHALARELMRTRNKRLMLEYLRLRRAAN